MRPQLFAIIDDREPVPQEQKRLIGDIHFGDLLRRRRRYLDELVAAAAGANDVTVLRRDEETEQLVRRIEAARGEALWLRLPTCIAPFDMAQLDFLIRKMRYALTPVFLGPMFEDDAPMVLFPDGAVELLSARSGKERRSYLLQLAEETVTVAHQVEFADLRQTDGLRRFLAGATEARAFNRLSVESGVFVKSSADIEKMRAEHGFFELAPPEMRRFLLPTFDYEERDGEASYKMEHLRVPDAALHFVLGSFSQAGFSQLLDQFFAFVAARERVPRSKAEVQSAGQVQILEKMNHRLDTFLATDTGTQVENYLKAGDVADGLRGLARRATLFVEKALARNGADYLAFSHGDPCLSNILFDDRIGLIRLIDPRGATVREDALMHPLYDLAKFSHSVCGGYDFVNNDLFSVEINGDFELAVHKHRGGPQDWVRHRFCDRLDAEGWRYEEVRAVEASLFLSMLPLHLDHQRKLLGFALIAKGIIEELEAADG